MRWDCRIRRGGDPWDPTTCDDLAAWSLMHDGYTSYPDTYLLPDDKEILIRSHFFNPDLEALTGPPASLGLDLFYKKYLDADGLPIVSSAEVPNAALFRARDIIDEMLVNRPDLRATIAEMGVRVAIMAESEVTTDIPEHSDLYEAFPSTDWNARARGLGATRVRPATSAAEENLLCYGDDVYRNEDILVHEVAHTVLQMGVELQPKGTTFRTRLESAYKDALAAGLWENTYASTNPDEYWAETVQSWFGVNDWAIPTNGIHNHINTRHELESYDPRIADLIGEVFGETTISSTCHNVAITPPPGAPPSYDVDNTTLIEITPIGQGVSVTSENQILVELELGDIVPANPFDLAGRTLVFTPDGRGGYSRAVEPLDWDSEDRGERPERPVEIELEHFQFDFSGRKWPSFFLSKTGLIAFGKEFPSERTPARFGTMRMIADAMVETPTISALYKPYLGGNIYVSNLPDRVVITFYAYDYEMGRVRTEAQGNLRLPDRPTLRRARGIQLRTRPVGSGRGVPRRHSGHISDRSDDRGGPMDS